MRLDKRCSACGCVLEQHVHKHELPVSELQSVDQFLDSLRITGDRSSKEAINRSLQNKEK
jgi:hypothetical protein